MHLDFLKRFYPDFKDKKILELGCGRGDFLLECHKERLDIVGVDVNPEYIKISEEKIKKSGFEPHIILAKGKELPFKDNYFDFINCVEVLEYTRDPEKVLMECYRVLKSNGQIFITIHNRFGARDAHYRLWFLNWMPRFLGKIYIGVMKRRKDPEKFLDIQNIDKMHYYTYPKFKRMVENISFEINDLKKNQIYNPGLILNTKSKAIATIFKRARLSFILYTMYTFFNNSFHFILKKK